LKGDLLMKKKLLVASLLALAGTGVMAQSAFQGFYGQVGTGYEGNSFSSLNSTGTQAGFATETWSSGDQNANGLPAVVGLGFNAAVAPSWLLGLGVDYSLLKTKTSDYGRVGASPATAVGTTLTGSSLETSNRLNIFLSPGYVIDKDKLAYFKAGYSSVQVTQVTGNGVTVNGAVQPALTWSSNPSTTVSGYIVGLGYKQMITKGLYGFVEGNYMSYGAANLSATGTSAGRNLGYTLSNSPKLTTMQLLAGVGYKF
jgi:hypothetical protein